MERLIQHIDTQNLDALSNNDIAREYLAFKEQQLQGTKRFVENSAFLSVLGGLAVIDGGLCLFTWFLLIFIYFCTMILTQMVLLTLGVFQTVWPLDAASHAGGVRSCSAVHISAVPAIGRPAGIS